MQKRIAAAILAAVLSASLTSPAVQAHGGGAPKHGGVVQTSNDLSFELVGTAAGAAIYVEDHGQPLAPTGLTGKLTVLNGQEKSEAPLTVVGNRLEAAGVKLAKGAKVVAVLTNAQQKSITVRFTVK